MSEKYTERYHNILQKTGAALLSLQTKISDDQELLQSLYAGEETIIKEKIQNWLLYDLIRLARHIVGDNPDLLSLECFGLILIRLKLENPDKESMLDYDYKVIESVFNDKLHSNAAAKTLSLIETESPEESHKEYLPEEIQMQIPDTDFFLIPVLRVVNHPLEEQYTTELNRFSTTIAKADDIVTPEEEEAVKRIFEVLQKKVIIQNQQNITEVTIKKDILPSNESLEEALDDLYDLIALNEVKTEVSTLMNFVKVQNMRRETGLKSPQLSYHLVFTGNPGTGKTIVARIIAKLYKHLGVLSSGHFIETDRSGLVANYTGQTATKTSALIDSALNGILFIDEAYSLIGQNMDDFGNEAVSTLLKRMEDDRENLVVIIAGYPEEMHRFLDANPGLRSRFSRYIHFPDYNPEEMMEIFQYNCRKLEYELPEMSLDKLHHIFINAYANKDKHFGNGRFVRNLFEKAIENQANRIASAPNITREMLLTIEEQDLPRL